MQLEKFPHGSQLYLNPFWRDSKPEALYHLAIQAGVDGGIMKYSIIVISLQ